MKKLKLEDVAVESFAVEAAAQEQGTVGAHDRSEWETCPPQYTCGAWITCADGCTLALC